MLSFTASLSPNSTAFALFVNEKYDYKDVKSILSKDISKKIDLFLKSLKAKNQFFSWCIKRKKRERRREFF